MSSRRDCFVGIDFGTSGCRAIALDAQEQSIAEARVAYRAASGQNKNVLAEDWLNDLETLLLDLKAQITPAFRIVAFCIDGTSGTCLLHNQTGEAISPVLLYNDSRAAAYTAYFAEQLPVDSAAQGNSSALARAMYLLAHYGEENCQVSAQASWLAGQLMGNFDNMDENNALKFGYDPVSREWPNSISQYLPSHQRPQIVPVGSKIGTLCTSWQQRLAIEHEVTIIAGTTDSVAAFIAAGVNQLGDAVTSLGSTLAVKLLSDLPLFSAEFGIYSHRIADHWLLGGASNTGGAVLAAYFSKDELAAMSEQLQPDNLLDLHYYPLLKAGERFPVNDPDLAPRLTPVPEHRWQFFQAMLEGIADIETLAYQRLQQLGAPVLQRVFSAGGGANNDLWTQIRHNKLAVPVQKASQTEAAFGSALLAKRGYLAESLL